MLDSSAGARPVPAVLGDRAGAAGRLPRGRGELQRAWTGSCGRSIARLARRQGRAAATTCSAAASRSTGPTRAKSSSAFYDFLLSQRPAGGTVRLLDSVHELDRVIGREPTRGCGTSTTTGWTRPSAPRRRSRQLSEQLRRFLDDQVWFENRRVIDILRGIESRALAVRESGIRRRLTMEIDTAAPAIGLPMERPLYAPVRKPRIDSTAVTHAGERGDRPGEAVRAGLRRSGAAARQDVPPGTAAAPAGRARRAHRARPAHAGPRRARHLPLAARTSAFAIVYDDRRTEQVSWTDADGRARTATLPRVTFTEDT